MGSPDICNHGSKFVRILNILKNGYKNHENIEKTDFVGLLNIHNDGSKFVGMPER